MTWRLGMGIYPGVLFGIRSYEHDMETHHVLYLPFVEFVMELFYEPIEEEN